MVSHHTKAKIILVLYAILLPFLAWGSYEFIQSTTSQFDAPEGTLVRDSETAAGRLMTTQVFHNPLFFTITNKNGSDIVYEGMNLETAPLCRLGSFVDFLRTHPHVHNTPGIVSVKWYCHFAAYPAFARELVSEDNKTGLVAVDLSAKNGLLGGGSTGPHATVTAVHEYVANTLSQIDPNVEVKSTSVEEVFADLKNGILGDLLLIDGIAIPLATCAMALCLRSIRMLIVPIPSVLVSLCLTFSLLYPVAKHYAISSFAPEFVTGGILALNIDFSLFLASRFRERVALTRMSGGNLEDPSVQVKIVKDATVLTSHNIIVSGFTVAVALGMLLIVPIGTVATIGGAYSLGAICVVFVSLTLQPCVFLVFFNFFSHDPCFNTLFRYAPFLRKYFGDDLLLESGLVDESDDVHHHHDSKGKSLPVLATQEGPSSLSSNPSGVPSSSLTLEDTVAVSKQTSNSSGLSHTNSTNNLPNEKQQNKKSAPNLNKMFNQEDLIHYRSSQILSSPQLTYVQNDSPQKQYEHQERTALLLTADNNTASVTSPEEAARRAQFRSFYFKLGKWVIDHPYLTLIIVAACGAPLIWMCTRTEITFDMKLQVPKDSEHVKTLIHVANDIGSGSLSTPFYVTADSGKPGGIGEWVTFYNQTLDLNVTLFAFEPDFWTEMQRLVKHLAYSIPQPSNRLTSFVSIPGAPLNVSFLSVEGDLLMNCAHGVNMNDTAHNRKEFSLCLEYQLLVNHTIDDTKRMALILLAPTVDPFGVKSYDYVTQIDEAVRSFPLSVNGTEGKIKTVGFFGASADSWAILHKMNELLPLQLGLMIAILYVIFFVAFRSFYVPFQMTVTVAFPVAVAIGLSAIFFQVHPINDMWPVTTTAFSWLVPIFTISLNSALSLDYTVFLLTRVTEYKQLGFTNEAAVNKGVYKSARTISFAGIIMCFSFGGMMFSNVMMMVQFGFVATVAVLIDTFIIRTMVVPALMVLPPDRVVWFPRKFGVGENTRTVEDMTEARGVDGDDGADEEGGAYEDDDRVTNDSQNGGGGVSRHTAATTDDERNASKMSSNLTGRKEYQVQERASETRQKDNEFDYGSMV